MATMIRRISFSFIFLVSTAGISLAEEVIAKGNSPEIAKAMITHLPKITTIKVNTVPTISNGMLSEHIHAQFAFDEQHDNGYKGLRFEALLTVENQEAITTNVMAIYTNGDKEHKIAVSKYDGKGKRTEQIPFEKDPMKLVTITKLSDQIAMALMASAIKTTKE